jgi:glycosyltransferase involved in cell wall biosynthesis
MKILLIAPYVPHPPTHGGRIRSAVLLQALTDGNDVHLAVPIADAAARWHADALAAATGLTVTALPARAAIAASPLQKLECWCGGRSELLARRWTLASGSALADLVARGGFDLLVADSSFVLPILPTVTPPLLLHLHNVESALLGRADAVRRGLLERWTRRIEARRIAVAERGAAEHANLCVTVSELDRQRLLALAPTARVVVIANSVHLENLPALPPSTATAPMLLFVGGFDYPPNLEAVTELVREHLPALREAFPGLRLRCIGRTDVGTVQHLATADGVEFTGAVDDLLPHYRAATAVYLPIRSAGGTRLKVLEALALGRPVLSTAIGVEGLDLQPDRDYLRIETPAEGIAALRTVLAGGTTAMVERGRRLVEQHWGHAGAIAAWRAALPQALQVRTNAAGPANDPPLTPLLRLFARLIGRPLGALWLLATRRG